jgi:hypothetical protein
MKTTNAATEYATISARMTARGALIDAATAAGQWDEVDRLTKLQNRDDSKAVRLYRAIDDAARATRTAWTM